MKHAENIATSKSIDVLLNYEAIKYFNNEQYEEDQHSDMLVDYKNKALNNKLTLSVLNIGQVGIIFCGLVAMLLYCAYDISIGVLDIGVFIVIQLYLLQIYRPLSNLGFAYREINAASIDVGYMLDAPEEQDEIKDPVDPRQMDQCKDDVIFENVTFSYEDRTILDQISFHISCGKTIALAGPSGAGKSTIAKLLFRFYDVNGGAIKVDNTNIKDVTKSSFRQYLGVVRQDPVIFNNTLFYNILYGNLQATDEMVFEAVGAASLTCLYRNCSKVTYSCRGEKVEVIKRGSDSVLL